MKRQRKEQTNGVRLALFYYDDDSIELGKKLRQLQLRQNAHKSSMEDQLLLSFNSSSFNEQAIQSFNQIFFVHDHQYMPISKTQLSGDNLYRIQQSQYLFDRYCSPTKDQIRVELMQRSNVVPIPKTEMAQHDLGDDSSSLKGRDTFKRQVQDIGPSGAIGEVCQKSITQVFDKRTTKFFKEQLFQAKSSFANKLNAGEESVYANKEENAKIQNEAQPLEPNDFSYWMRAQKNKSQNLLQRHNPYNQQRNAQILLSKRESELINTRSMGGEANFQLNRMVNIQNYQTKSNNRNVVTKKPNLMSKNSSKLRAQPQRQRSRSKIDLHKIANPAKTIDMPQTLFRSMKVCQAPAQLSLEGMQQDDQNSMKSESGQSLSDLDSFVDISQLTKMNIADKKLNKNIRKNNQKGGGFQQKPHRPSVSKSEYKPSFGKFKRSTSNRNFTNLLQNRQSNNQNGITPPLQACRQMRSRTPNRQSSYVHLPMRFEKIKVLGPRALKLVNEQSKHNKQSSYIERYNQRVASHKHLVFLSKSLKVFYSDYFTLQKGPEELNVVQQFASEYVTHMQHNKSEERHDDSAAKLDQIDQSSYDLDSISDVEKSSTSRPDDPNQRINSHLYKKKQRSQNTSDMKSSQPNKNDQKSSASKSHPSFSSMDYSSQQRKRVYKQTKMIQKDQQLIVNSLRGSSYIKGRSGVSRNPKETLPSSKHLNNTQQKSSNELSRNQQPHAATSYSNGFSRALPGSNSISGGVTGNQIASEEELRVDTGQSSLQGVSNQISVSITSKTSSQKLQPLDNGEDYDDFSGDISKLNTVIQPPKHHYSSVNHQAFFGTHRELVTGIEGVPSQDTSSEFSFKRKDSNQKQIMLERLRMGRCEFNSINENENNEVSPSTLLEECKVVQEQHPFEETTPNQSPVQKIPTIQCLTNVHDNFSSQLVSFQKQKFERNHRQNQHIPQHQNYMHTQQYDQMQNPVLITRKSKTDQNGGSQQYNNRRQISPENHCILESLDQLQFLFEKGSYLRVMSPCESPTSPTFKTPKNNNANNNTTGNNNIVNEDDETGKFAGNNNSSNLNDMPFEICQDTSQASQLDKPPPLQSTKHQTIEKFNFQLTEEETKYSHKPQQKARKQSPNFQEHNKSLVFKRGHHQRWPSQSAQKMHQTCVEIKPVEFDNYSQAHLTAFSKSETKQELNQLMHTTMVSTKFDPREHVRRFKKARAEQKLAVQLQPMQQLDDDQ